MGVRQTLISRGGPGGPSFARESTVWTRSEGSLFPFLLSFTYIVCGCFVNSSVLLSNIPLPSIAYSFTCFSLKVQGETDGEERGKKACLVLAWGPHALLWEAAWMINGGRSHSGGRWHPRLQRNWGIVMRIDVRTWNGKYGALLEWRRETQVTGREEKSLNAVRTHSMALAGPLPDLLCLFMKQSRPSLHEKPQWQHLVVIWPNGLGALLTNEQINLGGLVALLRTHPLPLPSLPCFHLYLSFSYQGYYSFANCFFSFFFYYYFCVHVMF